MLLDRSRLVHIEVLLHEAVDTVYVLTGLKERVSGFSERLTIHRVVDLLEFLLTALDEHIVLEAVLGHLEEVCSLLSVLDDGCVGYRDACLLL